MNDASSVISVPALRIFCRSWRRAGYAARTPATSVRTRSPNSAERLLTINANEKSASKSSRCDRSYASLLRAAMVFRVATTVSRSKPPWSSNPGVTRRADFSTNVSVSSGVFPLPTSGVRSTASSKAIILARCASRRSGAIVSTAAPAHAQ